MGSISTVFQVEVMAILRTELVLSKNVKRKIYVCSDSRPSSTTLAKQPPNQLWENMQALVNVSGSNEVTLVWIFGRHAIPSNEEGDKLAKEGINGVPCDQSVGIPFVVCKEVIRNPLKQDP